MEVVVNNEFQEHRNGVVPNGGGAASNENNGPASAEEGSSQEEEPPKIEEIVTPDVIQSIINGYNSELKLVNFKAEPGTSLGDNYMSIIYALDIELDAGNGGGAPEKLYVMLKNIPRNVMRAEMIHEMNAFRKEAIMYQQVFQDLIKIQKERDVPKEHVYSGWPICYAVHLNNSTDYLALENLKVAGYKMVNRALGLDYNHCALVLRNLARFHATSFAKYGGNRENILQEHPLLTNNMFHPATKTGQMEKEFVRASFRFLAETFEKMGEPEPASRLVSLADCDFNIIRRLVSDNIEHAVITHGDCWVNNILLKYDDPKATTPADVKFLDFQQSSASSRLVDFYYFLMTSAKMDVLNGREEDLLLTYYSEFTAASQQLGLDTKEHGMSWTKFLKEADKFRTYGVFMGLFLAPVINAHSDDIPDMETMDKEDYEASEVNMKKFFPDITMKRAVVSVRNLVTNHLPKCEDLSVICKL